MTLVAALVAASRRAPSGKVYFFCTSVFLVGGLVPVYSSCGQWRCSSVPTCNLLGVPLEGFPVEPDCSLVVSGGDRWWSSLISSASFFEACSC